MEPSTYWILKIFFGGISAFFVLLAAIFSYFGSAFQKDQDEKIKTGCKNKWKKLDNSPSPKLPEIIIRSLLNFRERFALFAQTDYRLLANNLYINIYFCPYSNFWSLDSSVTKAWRLDLNTTVRVQATVNRQPRLIASAGSGKKIL